MNDPDPLHDSIRSLLDAATSDAPSPPEVIAPATLTARSLSDRNARSWWAFAAAAALIIAVIAGLAALGGRNTAERTSVGDPAATTAVAPAGGRWCSVMAANSSSQGDAAFRVDVIGAGTCADGFAGTLTVRNSTGDTCSSDVMADLSPSRIRLWFASTSGSGGATGRWEPVPNDAVEGVGIIDYPAGTRSWPIALPALEPGRYSLTLASEIACSTSARFAATFEVTEVAAAIASDDCDDTGSLPQRETDATAWTKGGCTVPADVLLDRPGPRQCGFDSARVIVIGWPLGAPYTEPGRPALEYVRDPLGVFALGVDFEPLDRLPDGTIDTGYRQQTSELWMDPTDPSSIYLVDASTIERWPLTVSPLCA